MVVSADLPVVVESPAELRRERILDVLRDDEFSSVTELGEELGVSRVTVRGDLDALARRGLVRRVRGGAIARRARAAPRRAAPVADLPREEPAALGRLAAGLVRDGEVVVLDAGSATLQAARALRDREDLRDVTVLTSALDVAQTLVPAIPRLTVVVLGGTLLPRGGMSDPLAGLALDRVNPHLALLECDGVDLRAGVTCADLAELPLKRRTVQAASRRVVLAGPPKLGAVHTATVCSLDELHVLVTGPGGDPAVLAGVRRRGAEVLVADG